MLERFITDNQNADVAQLALQRNRYPMLSDSDFRFALQQIEGRQRTRDKLPTFAAIDGWLYPPCLNLEQCSSERTARFKASLLSTLNSQLSTLNLIDATGGYGVDTFFMSEQAAETYYFEQNTELAAIAEHNFRLAGKTVHCHPAPFTLQSLSTFDFRLSTIIYLDPARRDSHGGKVFRLEDCTPNVIDIICQIRAIRAEQQIRVLLKLSPMLDFHQAVRQLGGAWEVYVVSVNNEVKELLLLSARSSADNDLSSPNLFAPLITHIHAVALDANGEHIFSFTPDEELTADAQYIPNTQFITAQLPNTQLYLFEPDAALLKAGAFRLLSTRYGLLKAAQNTHLYFVSSQNDSAKQDINYQLSMINCLGRSWQVLDAYAHTKDVQRALAREHITHANVLTRNYVLPADTLRKQLRFKDGGDDYIIGCRIADKPVLLHCRRYKRI